MGKTPGFYHKSLVLQDAGQSMVDLDSRHGFPKWYGAVGSQQGGTRMSHLMADAGEHAERQVRGIALSATLRSKFPAGLCHGRLGLSVLSTSVTKQTGDMLYSGARRLRLHSVLGTHDPEQIS